MISRPTRPCMDNRMHIGHNWQEDEEQAVYGQARQFWCAGIGLGVFGSGLQGNVTVKPRETVVGELRGPSAYLTILQDAWARFAEANAEYGDSSKSETGLAGQWADLYRKVMKLKATFWAGEKGRLTRENEKDVLCDLIGHALLALKMVEDGETGGTSA